MSCTKNIKKFLFFKYEGPHAIVDTSVKAIFDSSYEVKQVCAICECNLPSEYLPETAMLRRGYSLEKLHALSRRDIFSTNALELMND